MLGALSALVLLLWPAQVAEGPVSYPFTTTGFLVAQAWFGVHHLGLVILLVALAVSGATGRGRFGRGGAWLAVLGMVLLSGAELFAMRYAGWDNDVANARPMGSSYGISTTVVGLGLLVSGVAVLRARAWSGWHRWLPLATGVALFAALGWSLYAESRRSAGTPQVTTGRTPCTTGRRARRARPGRPRSCAP